MNLLSMILLYNYFELFSKYSHNYRIPRVSKVCREPRDQEVHLVIREPGEVKDQLDLKVPRDLRSVHMLLLYSSDYHHLITGAIRTSRYPR